MKSVVLVITFLGLQGAQALEVAALPTPVPAAPMSVPQAPQAQPKSSQAKPKPAGQTQAANAAEDCKDEVPKKPVLDETFCTIEELNQKTEKR